MQGIFEGKDHVKFYKSTSTNSLRIIYYKYYSGWCVGATGSNFERTLFFNRCRRSNVFHSEAVLSLSECTLLSTPKHLLKREGESIMRASVRKHKRACTASARRAPKWSSVWRTLGDMLKSQRKKGTHCADISLNSDARIPRFFFFRLSWPLRWKNLTPKAVFVSVDLL